MSVDGHLLFWSTTLFFLLASYAVLFSAFLPPTGLSVCVLLPTPYRMLNKLADTRRNSKR